MKSSDNPTCQHHRINNDTGQCVACGEQMVTQNWDAETVLSAPNLAACTNPACVEAMKNGTYDDTNPPAGCTNPSGTYIPGRAEEVTIGYKVTYQCERCPNGDNTIYTPEGVTWSCGMWHEGDMIREGVGV